MSEHIDRCPECLAEADAYDRLVRETEAVRTEVRRAADSVDWEALPGLIADRALAGRGRAAGRERAARPAAWLAALRLRPVMAGLTAGLVIGAAAMYLALRAPGDRAGRAEGYYASGEFLDRAELEMARRDTVDYLEKSQFMLLDVLEPGGAGPSAPAAVRAERARELLQKKRYINAQLERFQMAKAKVLCDQIELLFRELAQLGDGLPEADLERLRGLVAERQLFLKINLVKKELSSGV